MGRDDEKYCEVKSFTHFRGKRTLLDNNIILVVLQWK